MDLEADTVIGVVERALAMSAVGRERRCVDWAKWLWAQEIELAVYEAKRDGSMPTLRPTQSLSHRPLPLRGRPDGPKVLSRGGRSGGLCSACGRFTGERVNRRQSGLSGGDGNERA
jgi:hypothetical protein